MTTVRTIDSSSTAVVYLSEKDRRLAKLITMVGEISYAPHDDGFEFLIHEIVEQMLSIKVGAILFDRLINLCNGSITPEALSCLSTEDIKSIGLSSAKATYIRCTAQAVIDGDLKLNSFVSLPDEDVYKQLIATRGIGPWTAKMYLMFVLDRPDILPYEDSTFLNTYRWLYKTADTSLTAIKKRCKKWSPYSSIASRYFYKAFDLGLTRQEFHIFKGLER